VCCGSGRALTPATLRRGRWLFWRRGRPCLGCPLGTHWLAPRCPGYAPNKSFDSVAELVPATAPVRYTLGNSSCFATKVGIGGKIALLGRRRVVSFTSGSKSVTSFSAAEAAGVEIRAAELQLLLDGCTIGQRQASESVNRRPVPACKTWHCNYDAIGGVVFVARACYAASFDETWPVTS